MINQKIADLWNAFLKDRLGSPIISAEDVALLMRLADVARDQAAGVPGWAGPVLPLVGGGGTAVGIGIAPPMTTARGDKAHWE